MSSIALVMPQFGKFEYTINAIKSLATPAGHTQDHVVHVVLVDDASPKFFDHLPEIEQEAKGIVALSWVRFDSNQGLTAAWNLGAYSALQTVGADYMACINNDVKFSPGWLDGIIAALEEGDLVGPITNAPGSERRQAVERYTHCRVTDNVDDIAAVAEDILTQPQFVESTINGFFLAAKSKIWGESRYDKFNVFRPLNLYNSKGKKNPTPRMTLNEYELQGRWKSQGRRVGIATRSFVYHYRAVTRGLRVPGSHRGASRLADHHTVRP